MIFEEALAFLDDPVRYGSDTDPELIKKGLAALGNPQDSFPILHIAGTNGKGSTGSFIASILKESGAKVGHYTSPHVIDFTERIRIQGANCPRELFCESAALVQSALNRIDRSDEIRAFTLQMYAALVAFREADVDYAIIEAGIGGEGDATNVLTPSLSILTPIGIDHVPRLGRNIVEIAQNKSGIIKSRIPALSAEQAAEVQDVLCQKAEEVGSRLQFVSPETYHVLSVTPGGSEFIWEERQLKLRTRLGGAYQPSNAILAIMASQFLCPQISDEAIVRGVQKASIPGRRQLVAEHPAVIIDGAHNRHAIETFAAERRKIENTVGIVGMMADKGDSTLLQLWRKSFAHLFLVPVDDVRSWQPDDVCAVYFPDDVNVRTFPTLSEALEVAYKIPSIDEIYIMGSLYLAGEALRHFAPPSEGR